MAPSGSWHPRVPWVHSTFLVLAIQQIQVHSTLSKLAKVVERCIALGLGFDSNGLLVCSFGQLVLSH